MDATRTTRSVSIPAPRAFRLVSRVFCLFALAGLMLPAWASSPQGSPGLHGVWVVITVLAVLVAGLWLQSMRRRQF